MFRDVINKLKNSRKTQAELAKESWSIHSFAEYISDHPDRLSCDKTVFLIESAIRGITSISIAEDLVESDLTNTLPSKVIDELIEAHEINVFRNLLGSHLQREEEDLRTLGGMHAGMFLKTLWRSVVEKIEFGESDKLNKCKNVLDIIFYKPMNWSVRL